MHRPWTRLEERRLVELRTRPPRLTVAGCARALGRTHAAIRIRLVQLGVQIVQKARRGELARLVRRAWRQGRSDKEIAQQLGRERSVITRTRQRLGLAPGVGHGGGVRAARSAKRPSCWGCGVKAPCRSQVERFGWSARFHDDAKEREVYCPRCVAEYGRPMEDS